MEVWIEAIQGLRFLKVVKEPMKMARSLNSCSTNIYRKKRIRQTSLHCSQPLESKESRTFTLTFSWVLFRNWRVETVKICKAYILILINRSNSTGYGLTNATYTSRLVFKEICKMFGRIRDIKDKFWWLWVLEGRNIKDSVISWIMKYLLLIWISLLWLWMSYLPSQPHDWQ